MSLPSKTGKKNPSPFVPQPRGDDDGNKTRRTLLIIIVIVVISARTFCPGTTATTTTTTPPTVANTREGVYRVIFWVRKWFWGNSETFAFLRVHGGIRDTSDACSPSSCTYTFYYYSIITVNSTKRIQYIKQNEKQ